MRRLERLNQFYGLGHGWYVLERRKEIHGTFSTYDRRAGSRRQLEGLRLELKRSNLFASLQISRVRLKASTLLGIIVLGTCFLTPFGANAQVEQLYGTWRLVSWTREVVGTGERTEIFGKASQNRQNGVVTLNTPSKSAAANCHPLGSRMMRGTVNATIAAGASRRRSLSLVG